MQTRLIRILFCLITTFIYLSSADPSRDPPLEENVIRGLKVASDRQVHYEKLQVVRIWNTVSYHLFPSSNCYDFKTIELDIYFINYDFEKLVGFIRGGQGSTWGRWPFGWEEVWTYDPSDDLPFDFVLEVNVPQVAAATMVNRAGDLGPWIWILLCQPVELDFEEPTWFFMDVNNQSATAVGATTGKLITQVPKEEICMGPHFPYDQPISGIKVNFPTYLSQTSELREQCPLAKSPPRFRAQPQAFEEARIVSWEEASPWNDPIDVQLWDRDQRITPILVV